MIVGCLIFGNEEVGGRRSQNPAGKSVSLAASQSQLECRCLGRMLSGRAEPDRLFIFQAFDWDFRPAKVLVDFDADIKG